MLSAAQAYTAVLTFDDISTGSYGFIPDGYGGFNWEDFYYINAPLECPDSGANNGRVSGDYIATSSDYNSPGNGRITGNLFTFDGVYLTASWRDNLNIQVDGYFNDSLVYSSMVVVSTDAPTWCQFDYENIDELRFYPYGGTHHEGFPFDGEYFVIDDFTYIPEPASIAFLGLGFYILRCLPSRLKRKLEI